MVYLKIYKGIELIKNQYVDDQAAEKGIRFQLGSLGKIAIRLGETKAVGPYTLRLLLSKAESSQEDPSKETVIYLLEEVQEAMKVAKAFSS